MRRVMAGLVWSVCLGTTASVWAADGQVEINQACAGTGCFAGDAPGFPVEITASGSYRLTSNLDLGAESIDTDAIVITSPGVVLDLGGFEIAGPGGCTGGGSSLICATGLGSGIDADLAADSVTVRNGTVHAMGQFGVILNGPAGRVLDVTAWQNGDDGIVVERAGVVARSIARHNGAEGIDAGFGAVVSDSTAIGNLSHGIEMDGSGSVVSGCASRENGGDGLFGSADGLTVVNSSFRSNSGDGVDAEDGVTIQQVTSSLNSFNGIFVGSGVLIGVTSTENNGDGIQCAGAGGTPPAAESATVHGRCSITDCMVAFNDRGLVFSGADRSVEDDLGLVTRCTVHSSSSHAVVGGVSPGPLLRDNYIDGTFSGFFTDLGGNQCNGSPGCP